MAAMSNGLLFTASLQRRSWALVLLGMLLLTGCKEELFSKVDETDANAALAVLYSEGIQARKVLSESNLWRVEVNANDLQRALQATRNQGVPRERFATIGDLFKKEGLVSTPAEIRMRYLFAVSQELSNTLTHIDGVTSARVHPVIPVNDPLAQKVQPASAAVFIKHLPNADVQQMAPAIKTLVSRSIEGLSVENVSLTFFAARAPAEPPPLRVDSEQAVSSLALLLAGCLALTLAVLGWQLWRKRPLASVVSLSRQRHAGRS